MMSASKSKIYTAHFDSNQFVVGGGVAIFHLATSRVVICSCVYRGQKVYFLPKGRRDAGEESGTGAEREGYEEVHHIHIPFQQNKRTDLSNSPVTATAFCLYPLSTANRKLTHASMLHHRLRSQFTCNFFLSASGNT
jgi:hypothetical protein